LWVIVCCPPFPLALRFAGTSGQLQLPL
jgi:hypothetical protein